MTLNTLVQGTRDGRWLTRGRAIAGGQVLLLVQLTVLVMLALYQHGVIADHASATSSDFVSFYAAGKLALAGTPALAYDQAAHFLIEQQFTVPGAPYQFFFYPPVFLLLFAPLALLPYSVAFYAFETATIGAFLLTMRAVLRQPGWGWIAPVLAFPAIFWTFGLGQNAFLTASLFGGFTVLIGRRPGWAGILLGLLCYKPHFGLHAPIGLVAAGQWRSFLRGSHRGGPRRRIRGAVRGRRDPGTPTWRPSPARGRGSDSSGRIDYAGIVARRSARRDCWGSNRPPPISSRPA